MAGFVAVGIYASRPAARSKLLNFQKSAKTKLATLNNQYKPITTQGKDVPVKIPMKTKLNIKILERCENPKKMLPAVTHSYIQNSWMPYLLGYIIYNVVFSVIWPLTLLLAFLTTPLFESFVRDWYEFQTFGLRRIYPMCQGLAESDLLQNYKSEVTTQLIRRGILKEELNEEC
jgi:hypothetical protein